MEVVEQRAGIATRATRSELGKLVARRFMAARRRDPGYLTDLGLEALITLYAAWGDRAYLDYVNEVIRHRGSHPRDSLNWRILFTDLHSTAWVRTGDASYVEGWLDDLYFYEAALPRDTEGRVLFFLNVQQPRLLVDMLQGYCIRLARAGLLTGDPTYFDRCAEQYALFAQVMVNSQTGLWHHGRGWVTGKPDALSPDGWCRGQGWVLRGMVESLSCMPRSSASFAALRDLLDRLATALFDWQAATGMWHQVIQRPGESFPETSGTGMIIYYLSEALRRELLSHPQPDWRHSLKRAQNSLVEFVDNEGRVFNGCAHGAPMASMEDYLAVRPVVDDPHAVAATMWALCYDMDSFSALS